MGTFLFGFLISARSAVCALTLAVTVLVISTPVAIVSAISNAARYGVLIKGVFLLLAAAGLATLWMAVFADMGTSLIVTFNGMRLLREE